MLVFFHNLAKLELNEAAQYYDRKSPGLGEAFVAEWNVERTASLETQRLARSALVRYAVASFGGFRMRCSTR